MLLEMIIVEMGQIAADVELHKIGETGSEFRSLVIIDFDLKRHAYDPHEIKQIRYQL